jgi:hypothetical protein
VDDFLYIGSATDAQDTKRLQDLGIQAVINLTGTDWGTDQRFFDYFQLHQDDMVAVSPKKLERFLGWVDGLLAKKVKTLVHCQVGRSRAPSFIIAWKIHRLGVALPRTLEELWGDYEKAILEERPFILPHPVLKASLLDYFKGTTKRTYEVLDHVAAVLLRNGTPCQWDGVSLILRDGPHRIEITARALP